MALGIDGPSDLPSLNWIRPGKRYRDQLLEECPGLKSKVAGLLLGDCQFDHDCPMRTATNALSALSRAPRFVRTRRM